MASPNSRARVRTLVYLLLGAIALYALVALWQRETIPRQPIAPPSVELETTSGLAQFTSSRSG